MKYLSIQEIADWFKVPIALLIDKSETTEYQTIKYEHIKKAYKMLMKSKCEVCGHPATIHEGQHNFCKRHWQEWVREQ